MSKQKLWIDDLNSFFGDWSLIPTSKMTREEKLNTITRLILIASLVLLLFGKKDASLYILIIGLIIVIVIYSQEKPTTVEGFEFPPKGETEIINGKIVDDEGEKNEIATNLGTPSSKGRTIGGVTLPGGRAPIYTCDVTYYPTTMSGNSVMITGKNNALVGPQNPKTLMPPPIAPPLGDLDTWKASEWTTHSHVNSRTVQYEDEAGPFRTFNNNDERVLPVNCLSSYEDDQANNPCFRRYQSGIGIKNEIGIMEPFEHTPNLIKELDEPYESKFARGSNWGKAPAFPSRETTNWRANDEKDIIEPFISELQPGIYSSNIDQPILDNAGLLPDMPQPQTTLFTPMINGKPRDKMQIYVEDKEADAIPGITDSGYHTLDRAYKLPQRYVRERLPKRYGEWRARRSTMPGIPFETPVGYGAVVSLPGNAGARPIGSFPTEGAVVSPPGNACTGWVTGIENVRDLSGAEEMSEYYNKNKLDMYDVDENAPLYAINPDAVKMHIDVTNRFRSDMQESLMRKRNAEAWQRKMYPLDTNHRRMLGGTGQF